MFCEMAGDPVLTIRHSATWALGRIAENIPVVLTADGLIASILQVLLERLSDEVPVINQACWVCSDRYPCLS
jgi:hypothetical protein